MGFISIASKVISISSYSKSPIITFRPIVFFTCFIRVVYGLLVLLPVSLNRTFLFKYYFCYCFVSSTILVFLYIEVMSKSLVINNQKLTSYTFEGLSYSVVVLFKSNSTQSAMALRQQVIINTIAFMPTPSSGPRGKNLDPCVS
jgi:hypothetical protein